jgi:hypothetical protein
MIDRRGFPTRRLLRFRRFCCLSINRLFLLTHTQQRGERLNAPKPFDFREYFPCSGWIGTWNVYQTDLTDRLEILQVMLPSVLTGFGA